MTLSTDALRAILIQLKTSLSSVRRPPGYKLGLAGTALFMVLMPAVYLGLIGLVAGACWWHLTNNAGVFLWGAHGINGIVLELFLYLGPALAGGTMLVFMIRPLFIRSESRPDSRLLGAEEAPAFVELVHALADAVGAPRPSEIRIDSQVNASASFRKGLPGVLKGELVLTVGMPLLAAMNTREVLGILAHEFGHFAQGGGMRLSFVVRTLTYWFHRVVTHRDSWDERLDKTAKESDIRIGIFFHLARFFVWLSRRALWAVAALSHLVCMFLLRQMEYDADRHEVRISGSEQFPKTAHHLRRLGAAWQQADSEAARAWSDGALPRDFIGYVGHLETRLPAETDQQLLQAVAEEKGNKWATHPLDRERMARALAYADPGILSIEVPCSGLFPDWSVLAEVCSDTFYTSRLGQKVDPAHYKPTEEILRSSEELRLDQEAYTQAVGVWAGVIVPLDYHRRQNDADLPSNDAAAQEAIELSRLSIEAVNQTYDEAFTRRKVRFCQHSALAAGYRLPAGEAMSGSTDEAEAEVERAAEALQEALTPVHRRFARGIQTHLGADGSVRSHDQVHWALVSSQGPLGLLNRDFGVLVYLVEQDDNEKTERWSEIQRLVGLVHKQLQVIHQSLAGLPFLFGEQDSMRLDEHVFGDKVASVDEPNEVYRQAGRVLDRISRLYTRTLGRLARQLV